MGFFDEIGFKITQAGQGAVQKTKDMADIAKLNSLISEEEKRVNNCYYQIGKMYVQFHPDDYDDNLSVLISSLADSIKKMENYRKQLQILKGYVNCPNCGAEVLNTVAFCSACGKPMPATLQNQMMTDMIKCAACGQFVNKNMKFCTKCGSPVSFSVNKNTEPKSQYQQNPQSVVPPQNQSTDFHDNSEFKYQQGTQFSDPQQNYSVQNVINEQQHQSIEYMADIYSQTGTKTCPQCGSLVDSDMSFCTECGSPLDL